MEITLEKIELVKDRTGVTYAEAKQALEETDGSVVDAIIAIEEIINTGEKKKGFGKKGEALFSRLKEIVKKGYEIGDFSNASGTGNIIGSCFYTIYKKK